MDRLLGFVRGQGRGGCHLPGPALTQGREGILCVVVGPGLVPLIFNGDPSGLREGGVQSGDRGGVCRKGPPAGGQSVGWAREKGRGHSCGGALSVP